MDNYFFAHMDHANMRKDTGLIAPELQAIHSIFSPEMFHDFSEVFVFLGRPFRSGENDILIVFPLKSFETLPRGPFTAHVLRDFLPVPVKISPGPRNFTHNKLLQT